MAKPHTGSSSFSLIPSSLLPLSSFTCSLSPPTSFSLPWENTTDFSASSASRPDCNRLNEPVPHTVCGVCLFVWGVCTCVCIYVCVYERERGCVCVYSYGACARACASYLRVCTRESVWMCVCARVSQACSFLSGRKARCCRASRRPH